MRPITTQSFLTDLYTLKEAIASGSDVKNPKLPGNYVRFIYMKNYPTLHRIFFGVVNPK